MSQLRIKAGKRAYKIIKDGGFSFDSISSYFGPAAGPRWLISSGFDLTLLNNNILGRTQPVHLIGSSAGAWRFAAWLQPAAPECYQRLLDAYIDVKFNRSDTPAMVSDKLKDIINFYLEDDALPFALTHKKYRLVILTCRARHLVAAKNSFMQITGLAAGFILNYFSRNNIYLFADRVVFYHGPKPPAFCFRPQFRGSFVRMNEINFKSAVMASGAIPAVVEGVYDIYGAPRGVYRDGGLIDYHLTHQFAAKKNDIVLFFHHQERIIPGWLDKKIKQRSPDVNALKNVLLVFPAQSFIEKLPGEKLPDRTDIHTYMDDQKTRIKNWRKVVELAAPLGEEFLELAASGKIKDIVEQL